MLVRGPKKNDRGEWPLIRPEGQLLVAVLRGVPLWGSLGFFRVLFLAPPILHLVPRRGVFLGLIPCPLFSTIVLFKNRALSPQGFGWLIERRMPGKHGEGTPRIVCHLDLWLSFRPVDGWLGKARGQPYCFDVLRFSHIHTSCCA